MGTKHQLTVAQAPGKADMLRLLDELRQAVESDEAIGVMAIVIGGEGTFATYSAGDVPPSSRIGYLMCHIDDLLRSMRSS